METSKNICEELLASLQLKGIVSRRVKSRTSLEEKFERLAKHADYQDWIAGTHLRSRLFELVTDGNFRNAANNDSVTRRLYDRIKAFLSRYRIPDT